MKTGWHFSRWRNPADPRLYFGSAEVALSRMLLDRTLSGPLERAVAGFPAVLVTGPRQSGKTTLLRSLYGDSHRYVSLETPHVRERALADPVGFLDDHPPPPVILDEVQHVPELLSYLQVAIDEDRRPCGLGAPGTAGRWTC